MLLRVLLAAALLITAAAVGAQAPIIPAAPRIAAKSYLLIDIDTQRVLVEENAHEPLPPASLTKIMTSYVVAQELAAGRITRDDMVPISIKAWRTPGSRMFVQEGTTVSVRDLLKGVIVQSGNDSSVALAEYVAGSEGAFADMMNQIAVQLGMTGTAFENATGLPADGHYTTAADLALLTTALIHNHPETYAVYSERSFRFNDIEQPNRNRLLWRDRTVDGVKTGHTSEAGYCLVASALRNDMRLISVVMGTDSDEARMRESQKLLSYGFRYFETRKLYDSNTPLKTTPVYYGEQDTVTLGVAEPVHVTIPRGHYDELNAELALPTVIEAPFDAGDAIGELVLRLGEEHVYRTPLVALSSVHEAGWFSRMGDAISLFFDEMFGG